MKPPNWRVLTFASEAAVAQAAAAQWVQELRTSPPGATYCVALSGGRIARRFFVETADQARKFPRLFANVHFFWADERSVPPTDPESNFGLAHEHLLRPLQIPSAQIHRIQGEAAPPEAAARAEASLREVVELTSTGVPSLDLVFLGMGEDGHVASIFPLAPPQAQWGPACFLPVVASKPPPQRITLTLPVLAAARQAWVLASGPGKAVALRNSLSADGRTPLAELLQRRHQTLIFTEYDLG